MEFLSDLHFHDPLLNMATVLIAGIIGGEIFAAIKLPKVTGWIATGILLRQLALPGMNVNVIEGILLRQLTAITFTDVELMERLTVFHGSQALDKFLPYMNFVLGFIAFTVGATLYLNSLRNTGKRVGFLLIGEAIVTPVVVGLIMYFVGGLIDPEAMTFQPAILLAAVAIAGAPGTTVLVIQEARAQGILTRTLLAAIGLIDMVAVAIFVFVATFLAEDNGWVDSLSQVAIQFGVTFVIGTACALAAVVLVRTIVKPAFLGPLMVAVVLGSWGAAAGYKTSGGILACTFAGIVLTNLQHDLVRAGEAYLKSISGVLFALFFTFAGMKLDFTKVPMALGLVIVFFAARLIAKYISAYGAMSFAGVTKNVRNYLGLALLPHGGVAVGLIILVQTSNFSEDIKGTVTTVGLAALAINQLLGPSATRYSLVRSGEDHKDRPRLLDFLQEHRIMVGLEGSVEQVIEKLSSLLYATSDMKIDKDEFVSRVKKRHEEETTCLGNGLMIPHAILEEMAANQVRGVLGLSSKGLDLGAPDGRVVHAVLLIATPEVERGLHLQVISSAAAAITKDINLREQLYHARSAAHAYEVLHAEDLEDLNYFLEDAQERAGIIEE